MSILQLLVAWLSLVSLYHGTKPVPEGVNYESESYFIADSSMKLISDLTFTDVAGVIQHEQEIWDSVFAHIETADQYILMDMFLFNSFKGPANWSLNELSRDLCDRLIDKKLSNPKIKIDFITDPVNTLYGGILHTELELMKRAGINVILTDLTKLRDSNPLYSPIWRTLIQWFGNTSRYGFLPNVYSKEENPVTFRSYLSFLNLKANHRKIFVADRGNRVVSIITSSNPHSASADFSNIGIIVEGDIWRDIYKTEQTVAQFSGGTLSGDFLLHSLGQSDPDSASNSIQLITERKIRDALVNHMRTTGEGDSIKIAMFYLSNRKIIKTLLRAADNGASIQLILDPNREGFGYNHPGTPNQPVARELIRNSNNKIKIRWFHTHGEQFHTKLSIIKKQDEPIIAVLGSSNLTRKNLNGFNLETDVLLQLDTGSPISTDLEEYFQDLWYNRGQAHTVPYDSLAGGGGMQTLLYRFQETTGISTF